MVRAMAAGIPAPAAVIVGEPTRHAVVTGHKASAQLRTRLTGHAVHSSRIDQGVSAVMTGARLIVWLEDVMNRNRAEHDPHNPFEPPYTTLHCGVMEGGTAANIVASSAWFYTDIRAIPTEDPMEYVARYRAHVAEAVVPAMKAIAAEAGIDVELVSLVPGLKPEQDGSAERLMRKLTGDNGSHVVSYGTEAGLFQQAGWSTVVCGPGDIAQAHQPDEYIEVSEFEADPSCSGFRPGTWETNSTSIPASGAMVRMAGTIASATWSLYRARYSIGSSLGMARMSE